MRPYSKATSPISPVQETALVVRYLGESKAAVLGFHEGYT